MIMQKIEKRNIKGVYALTPLQEGLLFHYLKKPEGGYVEQLQLSITGAVDADIFWKAWDVVVAANEALRTVFRWQEVDRPVQVVLNEHRLKRIFEDFSTCSADLALQRILDARHALRDASALMAGVPFHVALFQLGPRSFQMVITHHHILYDGWSNSLLLGQFFQFYGDLCRGNKTEETLNPGYSRFVQWMSSHDRQAQMDYWERYVEGLERDRLRFGNWDATSPVDRPSEHLRLTVQLDPGLARDIDQYCRQQGVTMAALFYTAWGMALQQINCRRDIVFGTTVSGRRGQLQGVEEIIGLCINTLPLRFDYGPDTEITEAVDRVARDMRRREPFENAPMKNELFDTIVVVENYPLDITALRRTGGASGLTVESYEFIETTHYDLAVCVRLTDRDIAIDFLYVGARFSERHITTLGRWLQSAMRQIVEPSSLRLGDMNLEESEQRRLSLLLQSEDAGSECTEDLLTRFYRAAQAHPSRMALVGSGVGYADEGLTYGELAQRVGRMTMRLKSMGAGPGEVVAVIMDPCVELVITVFGILTVGAAYLPLVPSLPESRIDYIIGDCGVRLRIDESAAQRILCRESDAEPVEPVENPAGAAYVIYTSGSTGTPKGVLVERGAAANTLRALAERYPVTAGDVVCLKTSFMFDVSVSELFGWCWGDGMLAIVEPEWVKDPAALLKVVRRWGVTHLNFVPSMFNLFLDEIDEANLNCLRSVKYIFLAGEAVLPEMVAKFRRLNTGIVLENIYGPTEAAIYASWYSLAQWQHREGPVPIGESLPGVSLLVLDHWGRLQPGGVAGELCIGGHGLARGYVNRPELTARRFVRNNRGGGRILYKTGDLARVNDDGQIEFLGRMDQQVKIRGFRIELGEIQNQLLRFPAVKDAAVQALDLGNGERKLCAYVVPVEDEAFNEGDIRAFLLESLPDYMVPAFFTIMDRFPVTSGGKIDHKKLPMPAILDAAAAEEMTGDATNQLEGEVAELCRELLGGVNVGPQDNFFDAGGDSYTLIRLASRLKKRFGVEIPVVTLLRYPTIRQLSTHVKSLVSGQAEPVKERIVAPKINTPEAEDGIAIIGMAGRFPGALDIKTFWTNLCAGEESIRVFSRAELMEEGIETELLDRPGYVMAKGFLEDADCFDAAYFDYTPAQARLMDPQIRIFHECCVHALEDAGIDPFRCDGRIGLFAGATTNARWLLQKAADVRDAADQYELVNLNSNSFVTLVAYKLNLKGPAMAIQTACSTSLTAVDAACRSLLTGACELALAGGVSVTLPLKSGYLYQEGMIQSPDGHCRAFDAGASGTLEGNGAGLVVLKPLPAAMADGDEIDAVIKGTAVNNDGLAKVGYTAPSVEGQARAIGDALSMAGVKPRDIGYVEAHGTGTPLGDPVEVEGLRLAFGVTEKGYCRLGSVKTNIGHLDAAAGIAGLIKTALVLKHRVIPPSLHFQAPNPKINFANSPFRVNDRLYAWDEAASPRRAGVSSFGIGGTNAHVVLEEAPRQKKVSHSGRRFQLFVQSADSEAALERMRRQLEAWLAVEDGRSEDFLTNAAYTLAVGRRQLAHRGFLLDGEFRKARAGEPDVVFMFSGQGSQYSGMGRDLYQSEPVFRRELDRCFALLRPLLGTDPKILLFGSQEADTINETATAQPLIFAVEYALARLLIHWGVKPAALIGHSIGEYVAATLSGVFSLEDALRIVVARGRAMQRMPVGSMTAVAASECEVRPLLERDVEVAAVNGARHVVISGPDGQVANSEKRIEAAGYRCRRLHTSHAFHSSMMEPMLEEFQRELSTVTFKTPKIPFVSNVSGSWITEGQAVSPLYWASHVRRAVRFGDGLALLLKKEARVLVEIGAGQALCTFARNHDAKGDRHIVLQGLRHAKDDVADDLFVLRLLGQLWINGAAVDWRAFFQHEQPRKIHAPRYSFEPTRFPVRGKGALPMAMSKKQDGIVEVEGNRPQLSTPYTAAKTDLEMRLAEIWQRFFGIAPIGVADDFFELGGDSLKVSSMAARLDGELGIKLPLQTLFNHSTIRRLASFIAGEGYGAAAPAPLSEKKDYYPLSPAQQQIFVAQQMEPESVLYNMPVAMELKGQVDVERIRLALDRLMARHESLRMACVVMTDELAQRIVTIAKVPLEIRDWDGEPDDAVIQAFVRPFDLGRAPLFRAMLADMGENRYLLLFDIHHIVSDGTSMGILVRDFMACYRDGSLPPIPAGYCDFAAWSHERRIEVHDQVAFWKNQLHAPLPMNRLPVDFSLQRESVAGALLETYLDPELSEGLKRLAQTGDVTLYMVLFSIYAIMLANLCGQEDLVVGTAVHGRTHGWQQQMVGMFVNTLAIRVRPGFSLRYSDYLRRLKTLLLECFANQEAALEDVVEDPNHVLDTMFVLQNMEVPDLRLPGLEVGQIPFHHEVARFPLTLMARETDGGICLAWEYKRSLFRRSTIERFAGYFEAVAGAITGDMNALIRDIRMLGKDEEILLLEVFGKSSDFCPNHATFPQMFTREARRNPDAVALAGYGHREGNAWHQMSYRELDCLGDRIARRLRGSGVRRQDIVAVLIPRSPLAVACMLGIMKVGAVYLPIEAHVPKARKQFMLADSAATLVLVAEGAEAMPWNPVPICPVDETTDSGNDDSPVIDEGLAGDAAYIIYTSGTTGNPKGVLVNHRGLVGLREYFNRRFPVGPDAGVLQFAALSFDASIWEITMALLSGSRLVMVPDETKLDSLLFNEFLVRERVHVATLPPAVAGYLDSRRLKYLRCLITAGSEASPAVMEAWRRKVLTVNAYGPTETTVCASCWMVPPDGDMPDTLPIGRPFTNCDIKIVDPHGRLCPIGVAGEIVVIGPGVARGYLNRPEFSAGSFGAPGAGDIWRSYRTGDRGRWTSNGVIEFLGRLDEQVKIRGFRVEPGEVQAVVASCPGVQDCWVLPMTEHDGDVSLAVYVVAAGDNRLDTGPLERLRNYLLQRLPDYMMPAHMVLVEDIPLTPHGKPDRSRLPDPRQITPVRLAPPEGESEIELARLWSWVLMVPIESIGRDSHFFHMGGQSLKAVRLSSRIRHQMGKTLTVAEIFRYPTLREMAQFLSTLVDGGQLPPLKAREKKEYYPVSSVQKRLFILQQRQPMSTAYNMPVRLNLKGQLDLDTLRAAFKRLTERHEVFRTSFLTANGHLAQRVWPVVEVEIEDYVEPSFVRPFDLAEAPLLRAAVRRVESDAHILAVDMHHIICDGASVELLVKEFSDFYRQLDMPELQVQYRDYSLWLEDERVKAALDAQKLFWVRRFSGETPRLNLPNDFPPDQGGQEGTRVSSMIGAAQVSCLKKLADGERATLFMVVLAAYYTWLASISGQEDIVVGVGNNGRFLPETRGIIGMFVNTLALRMPVDRSMGFRRFLRQVRDYTLEAFDNQFYPFEDLAEAVGAQAAPGRNPLFDVMLRFDDLEIPGFSLPGLEVTVAPSEVPASKFYLTLVAGERDGSLDVALEYDTGLFASETVELMTRQLRQVLESAAGDSELSLRRLTEPTPEERTHILARLNRQIGCVPKGFHCSQVIQDKVWDSLVRHGDCVAFQQGELHVSFSAVKRRVATRAHELAHRGVKSGTIVGVSMKERISLIVTMLALLELRAVFTPLDPEWPSERLRMMKRLAACAIILEDDEPDDAVAESVESPLAERDYSPEDPIYIYFTSGTTGLPKGFLGLNNSLAHFIAWEMEYLQAGVGDRFSQLIVPTFDAFLRDVLVPLLSGGRICALPSADTMLEAGALSRFVEQQDIQYIHCVPSVFRLLVPQDSNLPLFAGLKAVLMSGEPLEPRDLKQWYEAMGSHVQLYNLYGTSETTMIKSCRPLHPADARRERVPVGSGIHGAALTVLDSAGHVCAPLTLGEIYIATDYATAGYLDDPELTQLKFRGKISGEEGLPPLYKTGDMGRVLADGSIDFLGREDRQVKIRGIRVELAEIERALRQCPGVAEGAVVLTQVGSVPQLNAFVSPSEDGLSHYLENLLPSYMMPSRIVVLEQLPRKTNGKVDYEALAAMVDATEEPVVPPANLTEERLLALWRELFKRDALGVETSFFELGGNSLNSMQLLLKIQREFNVPISLQDLFRLPTIRSQAIFLAASTPEASVSLEPTEKRDYYPLSPQQQRFFFLQQLNPQGTHYNMSTCFLVEGDLHCERLRRSIECLAHRQHALRTEFALVDGNPVQRIVSPDHFNAEVLEMEAGANGKDGVIAKIRGFIRPFDLLSAPLFRFGLFKSGDQRNVLVLDYHHIIGDGISGELFMTECVTLYRGEDLPTISLQYVDYAVWLHDRRQDFSSRLSRDYWLNRYAGEFPSLELPQDFDRPPERDIAGERINFSLSQHQVGRLFELAESRDVTLFMVLLSTFYVFLSRMSGQADLVVGTPVAGRTRKELESMIGLFVNSLALRNHIEPEDTFDDLLGRVKIDTMAALSHQDYQFENLVEELGIQRDLSRNPLFDVMFVLQNYERGDMELPELKISPFKFDQRVSKFDMTLWVWQQRESLDFSLEYSSRLFTPDSAQGFVNVFKRIVDAVVLNPGMRLRDIDIVSKEEQRMLVDIFNRSAAPYAIDATLHEVILDNASSHSGKIAVECGAEMVSFGELAHRARGLAFYLLANDIGLEEIVGVLAHNRIDFIVAVVGILSAGGAVMPIDPSLPESRIEFMTRDAACRFVLDSRRMPECTVREEIVEGMPPKTAVQSSHLAYIIYSSGTTGKPKGSMLSHRNILRLLAGPGIADFQAEDRNLQVVNYMFDVSIFDIFSPLLMGGTLLLMDKDRMLEPGFIRETILRHRATLTFMPTSLFNMLVESDIQCFAPLRKVVVGGEALSFSHTKKALEFLGPGRVVNAYGPSENSIVTSHHEFLKLEGSRVPIGKPSPNSKVYIIDKSGNLQPVGVIGELCIGGDGLARGYLNRPQLTEEKFVSLPAIPGERIYRTGDLSRWLPDGNLEFFGRIDHQVKIRGFRVELGEIESRLQAHPQVKEVVAVALDDHHHSAYLCVYIVVAQETVSIDELREYLGSRLPSYMVPSYFVILDALPLTANGKVDRKALPSPDPMMIDTGLQQPRDEIERAVAAIWASVLGCPVQQIGIRRQFFECGGQSLKATILVARVYEEFHVRMPVADFYRNPTVEGMALWIRSACHQGYSAISPAEKLDYYPLSYAQKRLYFLSRLEPGSTGYNITSALSIDGRLDRRRVAETFKRLVERHEIFRTTFEEVDGQPVQRVHALAVLELLYETGPDWKIEDCIRHFDLSRLPLLRIHLAKETEDRHIMVLDMHHIISDGMSMNLMVREFSQFYSQVELPSLSIQYKDFAVWQQAAAQQEVLENQKSFWLNHLAGELPILDLPLDATRPAKLGYAGDRFDCVIDGELYRNLKNFVLENSVTLFMALLALVDIFLAKICRQEDIIVGTPVAGRNHTQLEPLVGMFVNTLALRNFPEMAMTCREFIKEVKTQTIRAFENQDFPFERLVDLLVTERDMSRNPLFDVMLALQNMDMEELHLSGLLVRPYPYRHRTSKFDLTLNCVERNDRLELAFEYRTDLFKRDTIARFAQYFLYLTQYVIGDPQCLLRDVQLISPEERRQLLQNLQGEHVEIPDVPVHRLFERCVESGGDHVAVEIDDEALSYRELNEVSNRLACRIFEIKTTAGTPVAIYLNRSIEMIVAIMGVLKAGKPYLPISPDYPSDRSEYILRDSSAVCVIVAGPRPVVNIPQLTLMDVREVYRSTDVTAENPKGISSNLKPAYVIYTSGTTGRPKGVLVEHRSLVNFILYQADDFRIDQSDRILLFFSYCFDASLEQIFLALSLGARLVLIAKKTILHLETFYNYINSRRVTHIASAPSFLKMLDFPRCEHVKRIIAGGEACPPGLVKRFASGCSFYNEYGPTETTIVSLKILLKSTDNSDQVPVGRPLGNTSVYIMDSFGGLSPAGIPGELCIGGLGVGRGYLNQPELTADRFIEHPYEAGERLYKTGDLVKYNFSTGNIEFLGRIDHQVKIRGFRIETGEIESSILSFPGVVEAVVIVRLASDGGQYLCAYICWNGDSHSDAQLKSYLSERLPEYMIPAGIVSLDSIPLNSNGKVDRNALPEPDLMGNELFVAPRDNVEVKLAELWAGVLDIEDQPIGIDHNFFQLGGHSLRATTLVSQIEKVLGAQIPLAEIFRSPTIREMAASIRNASIMDVQKIPIVEKRVCYPLSPSQRMIFIEQQMEADNLNYNISAAVRLTGDLDIDRLRSTFQLLTQRHEAFRSTFALVDGEPMQTVVPELPFEMVVHDLTENKGDELVRKFVRPFDLETAPLLRVELTQVRPQEFILMVDMHHIISDGTSMGILMREFMDLYAGRSLPPLGIQYKDYAVWLREDEQVERFNRQETFWLDQFAGPLPQLQLPFDIPKEKRTNYEGKRLDFTLPDDLYRDVEAMASRYGITWFMALLGAFNILLARLCDVPEVVVGTPVANRRHPDLEPVIGMFVNTLALRNPVDAGLSIQDYYLGVKERTLQAFENQEYPFESLAARLLEKQGEGERNSVFDVFFSMANTDIPEVAIDGLTLTPVGNQYERAPFDLVFICYEGKASLQTAILFPKTLFKEETIQRFFNYFTEILSCAVKGDHIKIMDISISHRFAESNHSISEEAAGDFDF